MKPNFLTIGAQKAGTTWLYFYFREHPGIFVPPKVKETHFFNEKRVFCEMPFAAYLEYFSGAGSHKAVGEVTPGYLWVSSEYPEWYAMEAFRNATPERVLDKLGDKTRFIVILRNPIDRAISAFQHHKKMGRISEHEKLADVWKTQGIVHMGFYAAHLNDWTQYFNVSQFYITTYERLFSDLVKVSEICHFLGVDYENVDHLAGRKVHPGLGFVRSDQGAFSLKGEPIASAADIGFLKDVYSRDVSLLSERYFSGKVLWDGEFSDI